MRNIQQMHSEGLKKLISEKVWVKVERGIYQRCTGELVIKCKDGSWVTPDRVAYRALHAAQSHVSRAQPVGARDYDLLSAGE